MICAIFKVLDIAVLSYYGLIPEKVVAITCASLNQRKRKTFINDFGRYEYQDIPENAFSEGVTCIFEKDYVARIATKEKAICDSLCKWRVVHNINELKQLLFVDKRIDEDEFNECDFKLLLRLAKLYNKTNLDLLISLIKHCLIKSINSFEYNSLLKVGIGLFSINS